MKIFIDNQNFEFKMIPLTFIRKDITNVFLNKRNIKTIKQTLEHKRYLNLKPIIGEKYSKNLNDYLILFLKFLKESEDKNYLYFLNKYGDDSFCEFKIEDHLNDKGLYCYTQNDNIKYIGRCTDNFKKRINKGYGKIYPKNCYKDGQATNCHLNALINASENIKFGIYIMNDKSTNEIKELEKLILSNNKYEWNIQY